MSDENDRTPEEEADTASAGLPPRGTPDVDGEDSLLRTAMGLPTTPTKE